MSEGIDDFLTEGRFQIHCFTKWFSDNCSAFFGSYNLPKCTVKVLYDTVGKSAFRLMKNSLNSFITEIWDMTKYFVPTNSYSWKYFRRIGLLFRILVRQINSWDLLKKADNILVSVPPYRGAFGSSHHVTFSGSHTA
jgi:midasin (ATPase involved in ribosome maturation)